jgi:hypothetical protein
MDCLKYVESAMKIWSDDLVAPKLFRVSLQLFHDTVHSVRSNKDSPANQ